MKQQYRYMYPAIRPYSCWVVLGMAIASSTAQSDDSTGEEAMPTKFDVIGISDGNEVNGRYIQQDKQCGGTRVYRQSRMVEGLDGTQMWSNVAVGDGILFRVETQAEEESGEDASNAEPQGYWAVNHDYRAVVASCSQDSGTKCAYSSEDCYERPDGSGCANKWTLHNILFPDTNEPAIAVTAVKEAEDGDKGKGSGDEDGDTEDTIPRWLQKLAAENMLELVIILVPPVCSGFVWGLSLIVKKTECGKKVKQKLTACCGSCSEDAGEDEHSHSPIARDSVERDAKAKRPESRSRPERDSMQDSAETAALF